MGGLGPWYACLADRVRPHGLADMVPLCLSGHNSIVMAWIMENITEREQEKTDSKTGHKNYVATKYISPYKIGEKL